MDPDPKVGRGPGSSRKIANEGAPGTKIVRIRLEKLFGLYTYAIPGGGDELDRTPLLYGENGLGKTNILRILFHLLSPEGDRGHRTALGKIKFHRIEVDLSNGITVLGVRLTDELEGATRFEVRRGGVEGEMLGGWDWYPTEGAARDASQHLLGRLSATDAQAIINAPTSPERTKVLQNVLIRYIEKEHRPLVGEEAFLSALRRSVPPIYFLTADRTLSSDLVERDPIGQFDAETRRMRPEDMVARGRERALEKAILLASRYLSQLGLRATRQGSRSMHSIYHDLIKRLASRSRRRSPETKKPVLQSLPDLTKTLQVLSVRYDLYATYGLAPQLHGPALVALLKEVKPSERSVAAEVLRPYVESLTGLADTIGLVHTVVDTFITTVNGFLQDKELEFSLGEGMVIRSRLGHPLHPKDLSSGEQQLLLLLCHIVLAHESGGIFVVDEPELSLNIKWQRRLVDALLRLDRAGNLQFVLASHSMEILTRHRESIIALKDISSE